MPSTRASKSTLSRRQEPVQSAVGTGESGFTLIELLVVIALIGLLIGILLPALKGARDSARNASTRALLAQLTSASATFETDNRRTPGYFTARDMGSGGSSGNAVSASGGGGRGLTGMENVLLDLCGKDAIIVGTIPSTKRTADYLTDVGPLSGTAADSQVNVNPDLMASGKNNYFNAGKSMTRFEIAADNASAQVGSGPGIRAQDNGVKLGLPTLVDANGQPILAWQLDESTRLPIAKNATGTENTFVGKDSTDPARFYWGSNSGILRSTQQGKLKLDTVQQALPDSPRRSLLSAVVESATNGSNTGQLATLMALTGQPGAPNAVPNPQTAGPHQILPSAPRGKIVFQAPGADGIFLAQGQGARLFKDGDRAIYYGIGMKDAAGNPYTGSDGKASSINFLDYFDDIVQAN